MLEKLVQQWQSESRDSMFYQPIKENLSDKGKFLFVHQTSWQKELLRLYGNEICLLDATYRTCRYSMALFFLVVPTNVNYMVVGTFLTDTEDAFTLQQALGKLREWNPDWNPKAFMTDYSEAEISAVECSFNGKNLPKF